MFTLLWLYVGIQIAGSLGLLDWRKILLAIGACGSTFIIMGAYSYYADRPKKTSARKNGNIPVPYVLLVLFLLCMLMIVVGLFSRTIS